MFTAKALAVVIVMIAVFFLVSALLAPEGYYDD